MKLSSKLLNGRIADSMARCVLLGGKNEIAWKEEFDCNLDGLMEKKCLGSIRETEGREENDVHLSRL